MSAVGWLSESVEQTRWRQDGLRAAPLPDPARLPDEQASFLAEPLGELLNPNTPPERLRERLWTGQSAFYRFWGQRHRAHIRDEMDVEFFAPLRMLYIAAAANPNCPPDVLTAAAEAAPDGLLANPILPLLPLERPELLPSLAARIRLLLLSVPDLPPVVVAGLRGTVDTSTERVIADAARWHAAYTPPPLPGRANEGFDELPCRLATLVREPGGSGRMISDEAALLVELFEHGIAPRSLAVAATGTDPPILPDHVPFVDLPTTDEQQAANSPNTPLDTLRELAQSGGVAIRRAVVRNPNATPDLENTARERARNQANRLARRIPDQPRPIRSILGLLVRLGPDLPRPRYEAPVSSAPTPGPIERLTEALTAPLPRCAARLVVLADDGDRHVRAAAQTRLADPDFRLTL